MKTNSISEDLFDAIINKTVLKITYTTFSHLTYEWIIHPYYLKEYNNRWFLFGLNEESNEIYNIPLDRIEDIEQVNKEFIHSEINYETYLEDVIGASVFPAEKESIQLKFSDHRFPYVMTKALHHSQRIIDIDNHIVEISVIPNNELDALILSFGKDVEVLSPTTYRDKIYGIIKDAIKQYDTVQIDCID